MDTEGENIALGEIRGNPTYDDDSDFQTAETVFGGGAIDVAPAETPLTTSLEGQLKQTAINDAYESWGAPEGGIDPNNFVYTEKDGLRLKKYPEIDLVTIRTKKGLALASIAGTRKGAAAIREELGFTDYTRKKAVAAKKALQKAADVLGPVSTKLKTVKCKTSRPPPRRSLILLKLWKPPPVRLASQSSCPFANFADLTKYCRPFVASW